MKVYSHKFKLLNISICLLLLFACQKQAACQEEKPLDFDEIRKTLIFRSQIPESTEQLNEKLINDIRKRGVSFILSKDDEEKNSLQFKSKASKLTRQLNLISETEH
jgi:hypothetical protein